MRSRKLTALAHKSTGGRLRQRPKPLDPVGNPLTPNTVASLRSE